MNFLEIDKLLSFAPILQSVIFFLLFISLYFANRERHFLFIAFYKFFLTLFFVMTFMFFYKIQQVVAISFYLTIPVTLALIPLLYMYADCLTTPCRSFKASGWLHFLPSIVMAIAMLPYLWVPYQEKVWFVSGGYGNSENEWIIKYITWIFRFGVFAIINIQLIVYLFLFQRLIKQHKKKIQQLFAYTENINLAWLFNLFLGFFIFFIILYASRFFEIRSDINNRIIFNMGFIVINLYIGIKGVIQPNVYSLIKSDDQIVESFTIAEFDENDSKLDDSKDEVSKYATSKLSVDLRNQIKVELMEYMKQKPYHKLNFNIEDIADALKTNTRYISQVINETFELNFFNFVNNYRIEEAKEILKSKDSEKYTIEGVAKMVGFNSKSSFNNAFKRSTGLTPSEFKKNT